MVPIRAAPAPTQVSEPPPAIPAAVVDARAQALMRRVYEVASLAIAGAPAPISSIEMIQIDPTLRLPMLITSTEMGTYVRWALSLQEQLHRSIALLKQARHVRAHVTAENEMLLHGLSGSDSQAVGELGHGPVAGSVSVAPGPSSQWPPSSVCGTSSGGCATIYSSTIDSITSQSAESLLEELLNTPKIDAEQLMTPNLSRLACQLEERPGPPLPDRPGVSAMTARGDVDDTTSAWADQRPMPKMKRRKGGAAPVPTATPAPAAALAAPGSS